MIYRDYLNPRERLISGAGAFGMHLLFIALLVFGVNWQKKVEPQANMVDLWTSLPSRPQPRAEPAPEPPAPPPPPPVVTPAPAKVAPAPPPKAAAKPEIAKPDIAIREKAEKAEREKAEKEKVEKERRALEEQKREAAKREEEKQRQAAAAADAQRMKEQEDAQRKLAERAAAARQSEIDKYRKAINDKIRNFVVLPPNMQGNPEAEFSVPLLPDGNVMAGAALRRSSGNTAYDNAVERAILRAQPLPVPKDPSLFREFRELTLKFRPQE